MCPVLSNITNGRGESSGTVVGATATYTCVTGYILEGNKRRVCQSNRKWDGREPSCPGVQLHLGHVWSTHVMQALPFKEIRLASVRRMRNGLDLHLHVLVCVRVRKKLKLNWSRSWCNLSQFVCS